MMLISFLTLPNWLTGRSDRRGPDASRRCFKAELAGVLEHGHADLALHVLIVLDAVAGFGQQVGKPGLAGVERVGAYIVTANCSRSNACPCRKPNPAGN
jgi:hypothetical protein